jgi:FlaA1/EpsC-like NDP-sugar epimerase
MKILVTGGSGFLGKRLGKILREKGNEVFLGARNHKQLLLAQKFSGCETFPLDVVDRDSIKRTLKTLQPDVIIHAAATKFVDYAEKDPMECCDINILGTMNVAKEAVANNIKLVLGISTDKACPPIRNIYGMSKAVMEKLFCGMDKQNLGPHFISVRYGNVVWSTGSVLPEWRKMVKKNNILRTSGPEMYRFFFTVDEAVDLVLFALRYSKKETGLVIGKRMKAAKMIRIAKAMCDNIEYLPQRPGDREAEYLIGETEIPYTSQYMDSHDGNLYFFFRPNVQKDLPVPGDELNPDIETKVKEPLSSVNTEQLTDDEISKLVTNVPEEELE